MKRISLEKEREACLGEFDLEVKLSKEDRANDPETPESLFEIREVSVKAALTCEYDPGCDCQAY